MGLLVRHSRATVTAQQFIDADGNVIGVAIETPSGVLVWGHDYDDQSPAEGFSHLYLEGADDFAGAEQKIQEHAEKFVGDDAKTVGAPN